MILMSVLSVILFLGGWCSFSIISNFAVDALVLALKTAFILFFYIWVRASFPRYRVDQLMRLCWKIFLPVALAFVLLTLGIVFSFNLIY
jgi:NADH-quinone oxidoreductase subunit H